MKYLGGHIGPLITLETLSVFYNQHRKWPTIYRMRLRSALGKLSSVRPFNGINEGLLVCTTVPSLHPNNKGNAEFAQGRSGEDPEQFLRIIDTLGCKIQPKQ